MANRWNGNIATQTVVFRGTSTVAVRGFNENFPNFHSVSDARYWLSVTGGVSGNFSVTVQGVISGQTVLLAGQTAVTAAGEYALFPVGYSSNGTALAIPPAQNLSELHRYDTVVPPSHIQFVANTSTAGISANCTVRAALYGGY